MHSTLILLFPKPFEVVLPKVQHIYNLGKNEFSPNLKGVAQKMGLPRPLEVLEAFGGKSKFEAPRALKRLTIDENLVLISLTSFEIFKFENFSSSKCPQLGIKIVFENYFYT